jgi:peptidoglycan/LPS O-acetylase OafA/YrhL
MPSGPRATHATAAVRPPPELSEPGPAADKPDYRPALDGLRALAIAAVVAYHLSYGSGGFLGVDLFFVLSGYLITGLLVSEFSRAGRISILRFWARRVRRLYPALIPVIIAVLLYAAVLPNPVTRWSLRYDALSSLFYFANWHFALSAQSYFAQFGAPSPLRHFWSLAIEEQFYLVWPGLVAALLWLARGRARLLALVAALGTAGSVVLMATLWSAADPSAAYYSTFARAHELLIGALLALLVRRRAGEVSSGALTAATTGAAAVAVVAAFALATPDAAYYRGGSLLFCVVVAALIAGVEHRGPNPVREALSLAPVRYVGRISYALYLWHWPVIVWVTPDRVPLTGASLNALRLALMTGLAAASTHLLEEPIRRGRPGRWLTTRRLAYVLPAVSLVMVAMTFALTWGAESSASTQFISVTTPHGAPLRRVPASRPRVTLFGDSVPRLLEPSLATAARRRGFVFVNAAVPGCGVVDAPQTDASGHLVPWQKTCDTTAYPDERRVIARYDPDAVIWYSATENEPLLIDGASYPPATPQHRRALRAAMVAAHDRLTARGARLYLVKVPPHGPPPGGCASQDNPQCAINASFNATVPYVNAQLRWLARRFRDTRLISLDDLICPGGPPCPPEVGGVPIRPDGTHFSAAIAPRVAGALLSRTGAVSSRPAPG